MGKFVRGQQTLKSAVWGDERIPFVLHYSGCQVRIRVRISIRVRIGVRIGVSIRARARARFKVGVWFTARFRAWPYP